MAVRLLGISGSLRKASFNTALLAHAAANTPDDVTLETVTLHDIPPYSGDIEAEGLPQTVTSLAEKIRAADGVLISTPEYNYSVSGVLKNAIDWLSRVENQPFAKKPVAIMGASMGGQGTSRAQYHLRQIFVFLDARPVNKPEVFVAAAHTKFDDSLDLTDEDTGKFALQLVDALAEAARAKAQS
ncbi:MAG: NADPH-dependent FMN reductase [Geminicoccaceae bacterium]